MALTGAVSVVTPVRLRPRPYDAPVPEITVVPGSGVNPSRSRCPGLPASLASDQDTRTFLVTAPLSAIGGLYEQFRP